MLQINQNLTNINTFKEARNKQAEANLSFKQALTFEKNLMQISLLSVKIAKARNKQANANSLISKEEMKILSDNMKKWESQIEELKGYNLLIEEAVNDLYDIIGNAQTSRTNDSGDTIILQNNRQAVRNIIRTLAAESQQMQRIAILDESGIVDYSTLYKLLSSIHDCEDEKAFNDYGAPLNPTKKMAYQEFAKELENIARGLFALPAESAYLKQINVHLKKRDLALLQECFITGISTDLRKGKNYGIKMRTNIKEGKNNTVVDSGFKQALCVIMVDYFSRKYNLVDPKTVKNTPKDENGELYYFVDPIPEVEKKTEKASTKSKKTTKKANAK